ncbi:hypothetical protein [Alkalicoccus luteus]|uniref:Uncharacterized protein n=1 Tax=Alkalicoccus luteus TaxID=1237094 RepID=A0A969PPD0_9BACI|nr:hypothetical protein [Alkalicoccus luteus]NJP37095.1 hypothetical protein [Alkalicoccus luteus]
MTELELLKVIIRRLSRLENLLSSKDDMELITEQLDHQSDAIRHLHDSMAEMKGLVDSHHMENVNSDDVLLRSILQSSDRS